MGLRATPSRGSTSGWSARSRHALTRERARHRWGWIALGVVLGGVVLGAATSDATLFFALIFVLVCAFVFLQRQHRLDRVRRQNLAVARAAGLR